MPKLNWITSLVALAVVAVAVIGVIAAVNSSREKSKRLLCQNNLRVLSEAVIRFENTHAHFPGYSNVLLMKDKSVYRNQQTGERTGVNWTFVIREYLDPSYVTVYMPVLSCPADQRENDLDAPLSYVGNCGMRDWAGSATMPRDWQENGVFFDLYTGDPRVVGDKSQQIPIATMSCAFIARADGLQNTLLLTENIDAGNRFDVDETRIGVLWNAQGKVDRSQKPPHVSPPDEKMRINRGRGLPHDPAEAAVFARPSSNHPGGVNMTFCDGHVQFLSEQIDYFVYCMVMSSNGNRVREPGSNILVKDYYPEWIDEVGWPY